MAQLGNLICSGAARFLNTINGNITGTSSNVTGTVAIANGGTGATTRLGAAQNLTNESVASPGYVVGLTQNWGKFGYTTIDQLKTTIGAAAAASGGTAITMVTTGDKYTWNNKSNLTIGTTSTTALAGDTKYAGASTAGGAATSAAKLTNTSKIGDTNKPVYFTANGVPSAISYTIDASVPSTAVFTDTLNTAGSTDTSSKIYLVGATSQAANPQTYSDNQVYAKNGTLYGNKIASDAGLFADLANSGTDGGVCLYSNSIDTYGIALRTTASKGTHGGVTGDYATYYFLKSSNKNRGWIWQNTQTATPTNVASIDVSGNATFNGKVNTTEVDVANSSNISMAISNNDIVLTNDTWDAQCYSLKDSIKNINDCKLITTDINDCIKIAGNGTIVRGIIAYNRSIVHVSLVATLGAAVAANGTFVTLQNMPILDANRVFTCQYDFDIIGMQGTSPFNFKMNKQGNELKNYITNPASSTIASGTTIRMDFTYLVQ